jgi:hypothetical protein
MTSFHLTLFSQLGGFLQVAQLRPGEYATTAHAFTRRRKLDLLTMFVLIVGLLKKSPGRTQHLF